jgi:rSAM/selenodomain-associated transferase 1
MVQGSAVRVLVFAKAPRAGEVKTRLAPLLGAEGASALHAHFIERTLALAIDVDIGLVDLYATRCDDLFLRACAVRFGVRLVEQSRGDLGIRMRDALDDALSADGAAILIGTDCPALQARHLEAAATALSNSHDAVFVPVEDGGYALIGMTRHPPAGFFEGMTWSTAEVMAETRRRLRASGLKWRELETLWDVDRPADYQRLLESGLYAPGGTNRPARGTTWG